MELLFLLTYSIKFTLIPLLLNIVHLKTHFFKPLTNSRFGFWWHWFISRFWFLWCLFHINTEDFDLPGSTCISSGFLAPRIAQRLLELTVWSNSPTSPSLLSQGTRLYIPVARRALQSLSLPRDFLVLGAWLRIAQSSRIFTYIPWKGPHYLFK